MRSLPLLLLPLLACGPKTPPKPATVSSSASLYLRNTFDTDPSVYLGRFVPAGVVDLDESNAMALACTKHITYRFIDGGSVAYTESLNVGTEVGVRLGIPKIADANVSHGSGRVAQAQYVLTGKMVAEIKDPEAFAACCKAQPDQCSDRYVSEFVQGTGALFHQTTSDTKTNVTGEVAELAGASAGVDVAHSSDWKRAAEFKNPVYFAFKVTPTPYAQGAVQSCPSWVDQVPTGNGGTYVVGGVDDAKSEQAARDAALKSANTQALRAAGLSAMMLPSGTLPLRAESWCVTPRPSDKGTRYSAKVLAFLSDADVATVKADVARRMAEMEAAANNQVNPQQPGPTNTGPTNTGPVYTEPAPDRTYTPHDAPANPQPGYQSGPGHRSRGAGHGPGPGPGAQAATGGDGARLLAAVSAEAFSDGKLSALASGAKGARLTCAEAATIVSALSFSGDMLKGLEILRPTIVDPENWEQIVAVFSFSSDRDKARALRP